MLAVSALCGATRHNQPGSSPQCDTSATRFGGTDTTTSIHSAPVTSCRIAVIVAKCTTSPVVSRKAKSPMLSVIRPTNHLATASERRCASGGGVVDGSVAIGALVYLPLNASSSSLGFELCPAREKNSHLIRNPRIRGGARWRGRPMREGLGLYAHPGDVFVRQRASTACLNPSQKFDLNGRLDGPAAADLIRPQAGAARYLPVLRDQPPVRIDTRRRLGFRHTKKSSGSPKKIRRDAICRHRPSRDR